MKERLIAAMSIRRLAVGALLLAAGLIVGLAVAASATPPPRPAPLLWDDYILAVATLYQRDGDLGAAKERLAKLSTDDAGATVSALAAVYVPDSPAGADAANALRNLAVALTGRATTAPVVLAETPEARPTAAFPVLPPLFRMQGFWAFIFLLSAGLIGSTFLRRPALRVAFGTAVAAVAAQAPTLPRRTASARPAAERGQVGRMSFEDLVHLAPRPARLPAAPKDVAPARGLTFTFAYYGEGEALEEMTPILDPVTKRPVAGCGMTNGPAAGEEGRGYLGFLVWLHELGSREMPQTVGLLAQGAGEHCHDEVAEWADYARVDELVVARPGVIRTFETRRLRAAVSVVDVVQSRVAHHHHRAFTHLEVRLDVSFKEALVRLPELVG